MLGDPPLLTLRQRFPRPDPAEVDAFRGVPSSFVVDAMMGQGALDHRIKPLTTEMKLAGVALTARCGPRDNLAVYVAMRVAKPGDVLILQVDAYERAAIIGDHVAQIMQNLGIAGVVTDGLVRDVEGILEVGLPVFATGVTPNSPYKNGPVEVGTPLAIGGLPVDAGDLIVGDRDGVVVVPRLGIAEVITSLDDVRAKERAAGEQIASGMTIPAWVDELIASERTRHLD